jgi:serine/threonine protein kinase
MGHEHMARRHSKEVAGEMGQPFTSRRPSSASIASSASLHSPLSYAPATHASRPQPQPQHAAMHPAATQPIAKQQVHGQQALARTDSRNVVYPAGNRTRTSSDASNPAGEIVKLGKLGDGDFATVFRGTWKGHDVAVKVLDPRKRANHGRDMESDFQAEVKALNGIDHPHCLKLLATARLTIVTDIATGVPLSEILYTQRRQLPNPRIFAQKLASVMGYLHSRTPAVVHQDVKPENIIVDVQHMDLKLIDFGMAKCVDAGLPARTGTFDGSPLYAAPEALSGAPPSVSSEVWSLACVVIEMHGVGRPFSTQGVRNLQDLHAKARAGVPPWPALPSTVPQKLLMRSFSLTPSHRPQAREIAESFESNVHPP